MTDRLELDLRFKGVGRIHLRPTRDKNTLKKLKKMLTTLDDLGRRDVLLAIKSGSVDIMDVWGRFRVGSLDRLPTPELFQPLGAAWSSWIEDSDYSPDYENDLKRTKKRLVEVVGEDAKITDLPRFLKITREQDKAVRPRRWNEMRAHGLSFIAKRMGDDHWIYAEIRRLEVLKVQKQPVHPQTVEEVQAMAKKMPPLHASILWGLCLTGMGPAEFWEQKGAKWYVEGERVKIVGTKRAARVRDVPRVGVIVKPGRSIVQFKRELKKASPGPITIYDTRRTYAQWLELAGIPNFRQDYYMGHGPKDMNALYKRVRECAPHLAEDGDRLAKLIGGGQTLRLAK